MKTRFAAAALLGVVIFLLESCIPSIHPIYTTDKLAVVKELPGTWLNEPTEVSFESNQKIMGEEKKAQVTVHAQEGDPVETWKFSLDEDKKYLLIHTDGQGNPAAFETHVVKLGSHFFLDFYPTDLPKEETSNLGDILKSPEKVNEMKSWHLMPVHTFAKLEVSQNELKISMFDPDFLENLLKNRQIKIKHEKTGDGYVLTASPEELQKFAQKYATEKAAYLDNPIVLKRKA